MPHRAYRMPMSMIGNIHQVEVVRSVQRQSRWPAEREPYSDPPRVTLLESPGPSPGKEKYHASTSPHGRRFALQVKRALSIIVASRKYQRRCGKPVRVALGLLSEIMPDRRLYLHRFPILQIELHLHR